MSRRTERLPPDVSQGAGFRGRIYHGENEEALRALVEQEAASFDLIYIDPPFHSNQQFTAEFPVGDGSGVGSPTRSVLAYEDRWESREHYLRELELRLALMRDLLKPSGSLVVHVNWKVSPYVQVLLDRLFGDGERDRPGAPGFRAEIIWGYGGGGAPRRTYRKKHDNLLWYSRSDTWTFNPAYRPYSAKTQERGLTQVKGPSYELRSEGASLESWWTDAAVQKILSPTARENWKYPTQKPEALLERIIGVHSNPGDRVADFYAGSGSAGVVAARMGREWMLVDESPSAVGVALRRCLETGAAIELFAPGEAPESSEFVVWRHAGVFRLATRSPGSTLDDVEYWSLDPGLPDAGGAYNHAFRSYRRPGNRSLGLECRLHCGSAPRVRVLDVEGSWWSVPVRSVELHAFESEAIREIGMTSQLSRGRGEG